jgi:hypothetical protein
MARGMARRGQDGSRVCLKRSASLSRGGASRSIPRRGRRGRAGRRRRAGRPAVPRVAREVRAREEGRTGPRDARAPPPPRLFGNLASARARRVARTSCPSGRRARSSRASHAVRTTVTPPPHRFAAPRVTPRRISCSSSRSLGERGESLVSVFGCLVLSLARARLPVPLGAAPRVLRAHHSEWAAGATHCAIDRLSSLVPGARRGVSRWRGA